MRIWAVEEIIEDECEGSYSEFTVLVPKGLFLSREGAERRLAEVRAEVVDSYERSLAPPPIGPSAEERASFRASLEATYKVREHQAQP